MVVAACHCVGILQYRDIAYATAGSRERLFRDLVQDTQHSAPAILPWVWDAPQNAAAGPGGMGAHPVEQQRIEVRPALLLPLCIHWIQASMKIAFSPGNLIACKTPNTSGMGKPVFY